MSSGDRIGDYRVIGKTADGRWKAIHIAKPRRVVIEVREAWDWREEAIAMLRTAGIVDSLGHPGIARIVDHGVLADHRPWLASALPDGISLGDIMLRRRLSAEEIALLLRDVGAVLKFAHQHDAVHCGLRPHAIFYPTGAHATPIIIGDWGGLRAPGMPVGEAVDLSVYAAPELTRAFDGRADIYSLAVIAYRAFTGRFPDADVEHVPGASPELSRLFVRMLAGDPVRRPSAAELCHLAGKLAGDRSTVTATIRKPRWTPAPTPTLTYVEAATIAARIKD